MRWTIKSFCVRAFAVIAVGVTMLLLFLMRFSPFFQNVSSLSATEVDRMYFVHSPTYFAAEKRVLEPADLPYVQGEKIVYLCSDGQTAMKFAQKLLQDFAAYDIWTEQINGAISYYAASEKSTRQVRIEGHEVNLHIAVQGEKVVVGVPIIFGGY